MKLFIFLLALTLSFTALAFPQGYQTKELYEVKTDLDSNTAAIAVRKHFQSETITFTAAVYPASTAVATGMTIPANSIITDFYFVIDQTTAVTSADDNTVAFHCESANDLFSAADLTDTATGAFTAGVPTGVQTTFIESDGCDITLTTGTGTSGLTAGALTAVVEYMVKE